jgi:mannose-6-phosphate isomerase-like protein (cupin superfamily)
LHVGLRPFIPSVHHQSNTSEETRRAQLLALTCLAALNVPAALAQTPAPADEMKLFTSSADVVGLIAKAKADRKGDAPLVSEPILRLAPYRANLEYRPGVSPAAVHETEAEMMYVIEGAGTAVTGGKLVNEKRTNAANLSGSSIEGGNSQAIKKGDFLIVPQNTPHQIIPSGEPIVLTLHVPRPVPGK